MPKPRKSAKSKAQRRARTTGAVNPFNDPFVDVPQTREARLQSLFEDLEGFESELKTLPSAPPAKEPLPKIPHQLFRVPKADIRRVLNIGYVGDFDKAVREGLGLGRTLDLYIEPQNEAYIVTTWGTNLGPRFVDLCARWGLRCEPTNRQIFDEPSADLMTTGRPRAVGGGQWNEFVLENPDLVQDIFPQIEDLEAFVGRFGSLFQLEDGGYAVRIAPAAVKQFRAECARLGLRLSPLTVVLRPLF